MMRDISFFTFFLFLSAPSVTSSLYSRKRGVEAWRLQRSGLYQLLLHSPTAPNMLPAMNASGRVLLDLKSKCQLSASQTLKMPHVYWGEISRSTWLPREGNLNNTSQQMHIRFVAGHASFLCKHLNSFSIRIPLCWNEEQDKRHR